MAPDRWEEARAYLRRASRFGARTGLHRMRALLARLGDPHLAVPHVVHVGGTNGKGSVVAHLDAALRRAGLRVAAYTSPHLTHYRERLLLDGRPLQRQGLDAALLERVRPAARQVRAVLGEEPTLFELVTAAAYDCCRRLRVPWLVQEVGLGGRFDPTNVCDRPELVVLTNVSLDHTERLGETVSAIARDKAHIIKPHRPVVTGAAGPARAVFVERARRLGAPLRTVAAAGTADRCEYRYDIAALTRAGGRFDLRGPAVRLSGLETPLAGAHQVANAALAAAGLDVLAGRRPDLFAGTCPPRVLREGLGSTRWPGRTQVIAGEPPILVDGAHNPAGMEALRHTVARLFPGRKPLLAVSAVRDKDPAWLFAPWVEDAEAWAVLPVGGTRGHPTGSLVAALERLGARNARAFPTVPPALDWLRRRPERSGLRTGGRAGAAVIVVCGSLYLAGKVLGHGAAGEPLLAVE